MKNFFEKVKDLLYDYIDYIVMIGIVVLVVTIIGWRLDLIFTSDDGTSSTISKETISEDEDNDQLDDEDDNLEEDENEDLEDENLEDDTTDENQDGEDSEDEDPEDVEDDEVEEDGDVEIEIPSGSLPGDIGTILSDNGLIDDVGEFIEMIEDQSLESDLRADTFVIPSGSSIEEILEIITN